MILFLRILQVILFLGAPFLLLIRGAVFLHTHYQANAWISILGGSVLTILLVFVYLSFFRRKLTKRRSSAAGRKLRLVLALVLVGGFALQGLMYISARNVKKASLQQEFRDLHPILRLSVSTIFIFDRMAIMTDAQRVPEDYTRMGLGKKTNSLHYRQADGYVYAIDIRTRGRTDLHNHMTRLYFRMMGFNTLRHMGTADHLHVSLQDPSRPGVR